MAQRATRSKGSTPLTFTLKPRARNVRLSATHVTATPDETQYALCQRIAEIAHLPMSRLRVTFESAADRVLDKRFYATDAPKVEDIADQERTLLIKDLGNLSNWAKR